MAKTSRRQPPTPTTRARRPGRVWVAAALAVAAIAVVAMAVRDDRPDPSTAARPSAGVTGGDFHSLVADPTTPGRLFVGGHQAVSVSADRGRTWSRVDALDDADAMGWAFAEGTIFVSGHPGLNRSADGATTFRRTNDGLPDTDVHAFGASSATMYAAGPGLGVVASTDGGKVWSTRSEAVGQSFFGRILVDPADDQSLIAADARAGAASSSDGGRTWRRLGGPPAAAWVSRNGDALFVSGQRAAKTSDGGTTWTDIDLPAGASLIEADPSDPNVLYAGVHRGEAVEVFVSRDGGGRWARA